MLRLKAPRRPRARALSVLGLVIVLAATWALAVGVDWWPHQPDEWTRLVAAGDTLARVGGTMDLADLGQGEPLSPRGLKARAAYLLAFHVAQDAADVPRMLTAVERLAALGESDLADRLRRVARLVEAETGAAPARRVATPRSG